MDILITGGTGFVGSHVAAALLKAGHGVTTLSRSGEFALPLSEDVSTEKLRVVRGAITDSSLLTELMQNTDALIHNASAVGAQGIMLSSNDYIDTNIGGTNCIAFVLANEPHRIKHVILGSSISVYGEGNYLCARCGVVRPPVRRRNNWKVELGWNPNCPNCHGVISPTNTPEDAALNGEHLYATTKKCQEDLVSLAANSAEIPLTIFRYATIYGPGQRTRNPYMQMLAKLVAGAPPEIAEDGRQSRDFVYVSDIVNVNLLALASPQPAVRTFNIGSGDPECLIDFVWSFSSKWAQMQAIEPVEPIVLESLTPGDIRHCNVDSGLASQSLGYEAQVFMPEGIERLLSWYSGEIGLNRECSPSIKGAL